MKTKNTTSKPYKFERMVMEQYAQSRMSFWVYMILRLIVLAVLIISIIRGHVENINLCIITLILFTTPPIFERTLNADLPTYFELIILFMIFCAQMLGELCCFYIKFAFWDSMLHTISGFVFAALGFSLIDIFSKNSKDTNVKFKVPPICMAMYSFSFAMAIGVIWEFFECGMDYFFGKDMQKDTIVHSFQSVVLDKTNSNIPVRVDNIHEVVIDGVKMPFDGYLDIGLLDTMKDLSVCALGAFVFSILAFTYVKTKGKNKTAAMFIPVKRNWKEEPPEKLEQELALRKAKFEQELEERRAKFDKEMENRKKELDNQENVNKTNDESATTDSTTDDSDKQ